MSDWILYAIIGAAVLLVVPLAVLIARKKIVLDSIEIGWPPKITFLPKGDGKVVDGADHISAQDKAQIRNIKIESKAPSITIDGKGESEINDVTKTLKG